MSWIKLDDNFPTHPKIVAAGGDAAWLHVCALCYCAEHLTDGVIPKAMVSRVSDRKSATRLASRLVEVGVWIEHDDCYHLHDYLDFNPSREQVLTERRKAAERRAKDGRASGERRATNMNPVPALPDVLSEQPSGGAEPAPNGTDPAIGMLVAGYVDDYRVERQGHDPPREFRGACGKAVKSALKNGESSVDIGLCLGVIAHEGKNPNTLAYVLGDYHANRPRRML